MERKFIAAVAKPLLIEHILEARFGSFDSGDKMRNFTICTQIKYFEAPHGGRQLRQGERRRRRIKVIMFS
jgi:hypothetical protein